MHWAGWLSLKRPVSCGNDGSPKSLRKRSSRSKWLPSLKGAVLVSSTMTREIAVELAISETRVSPGQILGIADRILIRRSL